MNDLTCEVFDGLFYLITQVRAQKQNSFTTWLNEKERKLLADFLGKILIEEGLIKEYIILDKCLVKFVL